MTDNTAPPEQVGHRRIEFPARFPRQRYSAFLMQGFSGRPRAAAVQHCVYPRPTLAMVDGSPALRYVSRKTYSRYAMLTKNQGIRMRRVIIRHAMLVVKLYLENNAKISTEVRITCEHPCPLLSQMNTSPAKDSLGI